MFTDVIKNISRAKLIGHGLLAIDIGIDVGKVVHKYRIGGHWEREAIKDALSLGLGLGAASIAAKYVAQLGFTIIFVPESFIIIAAGVLAGYFMEKLIEGIFDSIYGDD